MKLVVYSAKPCWPSAACQSGYATDGGFPFQMRAVSELFDETTLVVPCSASANTAGETCLHGQGIKVAPITSPWSRGALRKLLFPAWLIGNSFVLLREFLLADAVYADIPGDVGTIGMLLAFLFRKPLFVRHCGNWLVQRTVAEHFWKWFIERFAGGRNVMLATGGGVDPPSRRNPAIGWIFATSLTERELGESSERPSREFRRDTRLIIACRQEKNKGTGLLIESLPSILRDFPQTSLDVVGDGSALAEFKALAESLRLTDRVTFHGKVNHDAVLKLLQKADLFCYPTTASEGFPKAVLEALACGVPVVTTQVSVLPHLISTGCGVVIPEASPEALADAVRKCFADRGRYDAMSIQAAETARQYSLERWRDTIGDQLRDAWGMLRTSS